ncbi:MAG TPA: SDR family oxidoreductase [Aestuariivirga sp.]|nr:SDR family oxidoreductase [Hyphomicrobiales bacterium]MCC7482876.1 SDR family oxidoreductase [Hyphomicrobiales bacterium]HQY74443.1 SDR family oxidoreductase [Aestuariivirga sp.]
MASYLITGASGGIGTAICQRLAKDHNLVLVARNKDKLGELSRSLQGSHLTIQVDMGADESIAAMATELASKNVVLDGLVLMPPQPHAANDPMPSPDVWRELFQTSFIGPLSVLKAAVTRMQPVPSAGKRCKIVIISGISSAQVLSHYATANVIRTAWVGQAKTLAFALGEKGIHINTLSLGGTLSPWYREKMEQKAQKAGVTFDQQIVTETENVPLRKYGQPAEVAGAVEALLSCFSDHITGTNIMHDGGFTRAY